jgi:hypothetical protein
MHKGSPFIGRRILVYKECLCIQRRALVYTQKGPCIEEGSLGIKKALLCKEESLYIKKGL